MKDIMITSNSGSKDPSGSEEKKQDYVNILPHTKLVGKEFSPLIIRRYSLPQLMFVALITDDNLDDLDNIVNTFVKKEPLPNKIQGMRNLAGELSEVLTTHYSKTEGCAVIIQADKMTVSSLAGDFMNHGQCKQELYFLLNFSTQV